MARPQFAVPLLRAALVGVAYYLGARLGVTQTVTPEGIAILWPPNAILLAAYLLLPVAQWPLLAAAALAAELVADTPQFPLWAAFGFGLTNLFEVLFAAGSIRLAGGRQPVFTRLRSTSAFLLLGPGLASALAALSGAYIYILLNPTSDYWMLWRGWWFGDALGLLLLTPLVVIAREWRALPRRFSGVRVAELMAVWLLVALVQEYAFLHTAQAGQAYYVMPVLLLPLSAWVAVRMGLQETAATLTLIGALAVWHIMHGEYPYPGITPQRAVWMIQQYLAIIAIVSLGLAALMDEIRLQRALLRQERHAATDILRRQNELLEARVAERTRQLQDANTALEETNLQLEYLASTDALTGVSNRRAFRGTAQREMLRCATAGVPLSMVMFDIDRFKPINDIYGHEAGDRVLNQVVRAAEGAIRPRDRIGRFGGEEFLVLLPDTDAETAAEVAERMRQAIATSDIDVDGTRITITASFGTAQWNGHSSLDALMKDTDKALYAAKSSGRNRVCSA